MALFKAKKIIRKASKSEKAGKEAFDALNQLKKDMQNKPVEELSESLFKIIKKFFSDYFSISYELTPDEFVDDIKKKKRIEEKTKEEIISFSEQLSDIKYKHETLDKSQVEDLVKEFSRIVALLVDKKKNDTVYEQTRRLTEFVRFAIEKGKTKAEIEQSLIEAGWPSSIVKRELDRIS